MTVAMATPATPQPSTGTNSRSSATFRTVENMRALSGMLVTPTLRKIAASRL